MVLICAEYTVWLQTIRRALVTGSLDFAPYLYPVRFCCVFHSHVSQIHWFNEIGFRKAQAPYASYARKRSRRSKQSWACVYACPSPPVVCRIFRSSKLVASDLSQYLWDWCYFSIICHDLWLYVCLYLLAAGGFICCTHCGRSLWAGVAAGERVTRVAKWWWDSIRVCAAPPPAGVSGLWTGWEEGAVVDTTLR